MEYFCPVDWGVKVERVHCLVVHFAFAIGFRDVFPVGFGVSYLLSVFCFVVAEGLVRCGDFAYYSCFREVEDRDVRRVEVVRVGLVQLLRLLSEWWVHVWRVR